jgi:hypothetical protein
MSYNATFPLQGGCTCGEVRFEMTTKPLFVQCCHCTWCQRESGGAFAWNAMIEADRVRVLAGSSEVVNTPSNSGKGQLVSRCPSCKVAVWSNYGGNEKVRFVRVGTLDNASALPPDMHIFTSTKQPWVVLDPATPAMPEYYSASKYWPAESLERGKALR